MPVTTAVGIGVVGLGYWGSNLARTFAQLPGAELRWICDREARVVSREALGYRNARATRDFRRMLDDDRVDGVVVATPLATRAQVAQQALEAGKDVLVQPPLAFSAEEAAFLLELATRNRHVLLAGDVLLFHPAVRMLKESIDLGELGDVHYLYGNRQNLGGVRADVNVLWSLGPQHVAAVLYLLEQEPFSVSAKGGSYVSSGAADVAFCHLRFHHGVTASLHLSWLEAEKVRKLTVVGSQQMAVFDELDSTRFLTVYDKGPQPVPSPRRGLRFSPGEIASPSVPAIEPLKLECESFLAAVRHRTDPAERALLGVRVVAVLEALERSLEHDGTEERISLPADSANVVPFRGRP